MRPSNSVVCNLVINHNGDTIFERNYLQHMTRYDTQAGYLGTSQETGFVYAANRMSRRIDYRRPKKLGDELRKCRDQLRDKINRQPYPGSEGACTV